jgi:hypothetical protein
MQPSDRFGTGAGDMAFVTLLRHSVSSIINSADDICCLDLYGATFEEGAFGIVPKGWYSTV